MGYLPWEFPLVSIRALAPKNNFPLFIFFFFVLWLRINFVFYAQLIMKSGDWNREQERYISRNHLLEKKKIRQTGFSKQESGSFASVCFWFQTNPQSDLPIMLADQLISDFWLRYEPTNVIWLKTKISYSQTSVTRWICSRLVLLSVGI